MMGTSVEREWGVITLLCLVGLPRPLGKILARWKRTSPEGRSFPSEAPSAEKKQETSLPLLFVSSHYLQRFPESLKIRVKITQG